MTPEETPPPNRFIFRNRHDHLFRALLMIGFFVACMGLGISAWYWQRASWQRVGIALQQPVMFSHKHHVAELGIDCRYCHAGVEKSAYAGVPPTETCMTCHSQIWTNAALLQPVRDSARDNVPIAWQQVTSIPNYVYFNHSAHISRGVACVSCHGQMDKMPMTYQAVEMTMSWCLACHRNPESRLVPHSQITQTVPDFHADSQLDWHPPVIGTVEKARMTNCTMCHR